MAKIIKKRILIPLVIIIAIIVSTIIAIIIYKPIIQEQDYYKVNFNDISFWKKDNNPLDFISSFKESCAVFSKKKPGTVVTKDPIITTVKDWQSICTNFNKIKFKNNEQVYKFLKNNFEVYLIKGKNEAHVTGYYRMELEGSLSKKGNFKYPIYKLPKDLVMVNLGDFNPELKGKAIYGRVNENKLVPYYTREDINNGILKDKNLELLWLDNKYSAFLLHIQGSGLIKIKEGKKEIYLSYAGKNGYPFKGIYNYLKEKNYLKNYKNVNSMEMVYDFFDKNPDKINEILNQNPSFIFFKETNKDSWYASFGTNPHKERTIAVDSNFEPLGAPLLLDMKDPATGDPMVRLVVANDTGSAIKGPARIDFYWGLGKEAGFKAVSTNQKGSLYLFLPKVK